MFSGASSEFDDGPQYSSEDIRDPDDFTYEELTALGDAVGTVSAGLDKTKILALPTGKFREICQKDGVHDPYVGVAPVEDRINCLSIEGI